MSELAFGFMRLPLLDKDDNTSIDIELCKKMVDYFIDNGFTYFDTAWMYCGFKSEVAIKEALTDRYPRNAYTLATKLHSSYINSLDDRDAVFNEQLRKTGVEYFDYYLLHCILKDNYPKYTELDCFNWLKEKKEKGLVKHIGFSFHDDAEFLDKVLTEHPEIEFVQLQLNYLDWNDTNIQSRLCYEVALKHNVDIFVMEPVKGGRLANVPEDVEKLFKDYHPDLSVASWALRFVSSLKNVKFVLSGMSNLEQVYDNISFMKDLKTLNKEELDIIEKATQLLIQHSMIDCTKCEYCIDGCPSHIYIPQLFNLYNEDKKGISKKEEFIKVNNINECIECGQCVSVCPQHLEIIDLLKKVNKHFN